MTDNPQDRVRQELLQHLLGRIESDRFPSHDMLDMVEQLLHPEDTHAYAEVLLSKITEETYPSLAMIRRVLALT